MHDLLLRYQFRDLNLHSVYNMHSYAGRKIGKVLGQVKIDFTNTGKSTNCVIDWAVVEEKKCIIEDTVDSAISEPIGFEDRRI